MGGILSRHPHYCKPTFISVQEILANISHHKPILKCQTSLFPLYGEIKSSQINVGLQYFITSLNY